MGAQPPSVKTGSASQVACGRVRGDTGCGRTAPRDAESAKNHQRGRRRFALLFLASSARCDAAPAEQSASFAESQKFSAVSA